MRFFVQATAAPQPKTKNTRAISVFLAGIFVVMVVAQLFSYEHFADVLEQFAGSDTVLATFLAAIIVTFEVAAIPFLLGMRLSPAARIVSMVAGWLVAALWFVLSLTASVVFGVYDNAGLLGDTIVVPGGWWAVFFSLGLAVLATWASWGMWPITPRKR